MREARDAGTKTLSRCEMNHKVKKRFSEGSCAKRMMRELKRSLEVK